MTKQHLPAVWPLFKLGLFLLVLGYAAFWEEPRRRRELKRQAQEAMAREA